MRGYSEAVKAGRGGRRMSRRNRQSVAPEISRNWVFHVVTSTKWRKTWRLQGEVGGLASAKDPEGWVPPNKFTWCWRLAG